KSGFAILENIRALSSDSFECEIVNSDALLSICRHGEEHRPERLLISLSASACSEPLQRCRHLKKENFRRKTCQSWTLQICRNRWSCSESQCQKSCPRR